MNLGCFFTTKFVLFCYSSNRKLMNTDGLCFPKVHCVRFRWGNGPLCLSPASNLLVDSYWGEQKKGTERWGKEKTCNPTTQKVLPGPGTLQIPPFYPKSSSLHSSPCKLLLTHQVPASRSHLQKHFLILHIVNTTTNISSSHIL